MNILFLCSPISTINFLETTTPLMIDEADRRGHAAWFFTLQDLSFKGNVSCIKTRKIELLTEAPYYLLSEETNRSLEDFEIIHQRMDPAFDLNYYFTTIFLEFAHKPLVVNRPRALRSFNEKLSILMFPDLIAPTMISSDTEQILDFTRAHRLLR